jgi:hypothetical protein
MTSITVPVDDEVADFSRPVRRIRFRMEGDIFEAASALPVLTILDFAEAADQIGDQAEISEARALFQRMFQMVLVPESAERFIARLEDAGNPIDLDQVMKAVDYVMEKYGMRPPQPSGSSSDGSATQPSGPNSTANAQPTAPTSDALPSTGS